MDKIEAKVKANVKGKLSEDKSAPTSSDARTRTPVSNSESTLIEDQYHSMLSLSQIK